MGSGVDVVGDWGSTRLRLFLVREGVILDRVTGPGIGRLAAAPDVVLRAALSAWRAGWAIERVTLCGMAGSRNGLADAGYAPCPVGIDGWAAQRTVVDLDGMRVKVAAGLACSHASGAPDVMRGEETQVFGALATDALLAQERSVIVLPGTHSKWVEVVDGRVCGFRTYLTGELFGLLRDHSLLTQADPRPEGEPEGFADGLARAATIGPLGTLFEARAAQLRAGRPGGWGRGFLSGLLIGCELAEARDVFAADIVTLIGDPALTRLYGQAFAAAGRGCAMMNGDACALAGLAALQAEPLAMSLT